MMRSSFGGHVRIQAHGRNGSAVQNRLRRSSPRYLPRKGKAAGRHFVQHDTEGEKVGARVQFFAPHLLRRHVGDRAQRRSRTGEMRRIECARLRVGRDNLSSRNLSGRHLRQPEIQNLGVPALGDEDVGGLDVAVDDAFAVRGVQRVGNLDRQTEQNVGLQRACRRCDASASRRPETP